jgi:hypothetical protein
MKCDCCGKEDQLHHETITDNASPRSALETSRPASAPSVEGSFTILPFKIASSRNGSSTHGAGPGRKLFSAL